MIVGGCRSGAVIVGGYSQFEVEETGQGCRDDDLLFVQQDGGLNPVSHVLGLQKRNDTENETADLSHELTVGPTSQKLISNGH